MLRLGYLLLFTATTLVLGQNEINPNYWINESKRKIKNRLTADYKNNGTAKNVIVVLVDGMDLDFVSLARSEWDRSEFSFETFPNSAMLKTYCIDGQAPDQACATTALLTGVKTNKGLVGLEGRAVADDCDSAPGRRITSMLDWAAKAGKRTGLVTTSRITGPSISSAYGHSAGSSWEGDVDIDMNMAQPCNDIAKQLVEGQTNNKFNVLFGGGRKYFLSNSTTDPQTGTIDPKQRNDGVDPIQIWTDDKVARGVTYQYLYNNTALTALDAATTEYALGLFNADSLDIAAVKSSDEPSLLDMSLKAWNILSQDTDNGYMLLIETSKIAEQLQLGKAGNAYTEFIEIENLVDTLTSVVNTDETLIVVSGVRGANVKQTGSNARGASVFGLSGDTTNVATDGKPRTTIQFATGPSYAEPRADLTGFDGSDLDFQYPAVVPMTEGAFGAQDVPVYAVGPMSYLFKNTAEQNYVAHAVSYSMCTGLYKKCVKK